jgi:hypothetical protein
LSVTSPTFRGPFVTEQADFGRIVTAYDVEQWCLATLRKWSSTYLAELERKNGIDVGDLARIRSWRTTPSFDKWPEDQLPAALLLSVGLSEPPLKEAGGVYRARWQMGLACVVSARTEALSRRNAMIYVAAHRALLTQKQSLDGQPGARGVVWQDENYVDLPYDDIRSLCSGQAIFTVEFDDVTTSEKGPVTPDDPLPIGPPWPSWQQVEEVDVEIDNVPVTDQFVE